MKNFKVIISRLICLVFMLGVIADSNVINVSAATSMSIGLTDWTGTINGDEIVGNVYLDTTEKYSGEYSAKLTMGPTNDSSHYMRINITYPKAVYGKTYRIGFAAKSKNAADIRMVMDSLSGVPWIQISKTYGTDFDWKEFEFEFRFLPVATTSTAARLAIFSYGQCDGFWLDDLYLYEYVDGQYVGENLFSNPGLEDGGKAEVIRAEADEETVSMKPLTSQNAIVVSEASGITIDGDASDWDKYEKHDIQTYFPLAEAQQTIEGYIKYAYDEEYIYYLVGVEDEEHRFVSGGSYWSGDGLQTAIDNNNENGYGESIGLYYNTDDGKAYVMTDDGGSEVTGLAVPEAAGARDGETTVYEWRVPWSFLGIKRPDTIKYNLIINDNDGGVRKGWLEIAPGIGQYKSNAEYPYLVLGDEGGAIISLEPVESNVYLNEKISATVSYANARNKPATVEISYGNTKRSIDVPAMTTYSEIIELPQAESIGEYTATVTINDGEEKIINKPMYVIPDDKFAAEFVDTITLWVDELTALRDKCTERGIPTEYEAADIRLLKTYIETIPYEITNNEEGYQRTAHFYDILPGIYEECRTSLLALLSGEKEGVDVPEYVTSEIKIKDGAYWATVEKDGVQYESPITFGGLCAHNVPDVWTEDFVQYGMNHAEIGMDPRTIVRWNGNGFEPIPEDERYGRRNDHLAYESVLKYLDDCDKNGISVALGVSTSYFIDMTQYGYSDWKHSTNHNFMPHNPTHPMLAPMVDAIYKEIGKLAERFECIDSILLINEPTVKLYGNPYYDEPWAEFLSKRYGGDIEWLNKVYNDGKNYTDFSQVQMVANTATYSPNYYDYRLFCEDVYRQYLITLTTAARKYLPEDVRLQVKEMQRTRLYNSDYTQNMSTALEKNVDILDLAGCDAFYIPNRPELSIEIKMMWYDYLTSVIEAPIQNGEDHIGTDGIGGEDTSFYDDESYKSSTWQGIIHGGGAQDAWHYGQHDRNYRGDNRQGNYTYGTGGAEFEPNVHLLKLPNSMRDVYTTNLDAMRLAWEINSLVTAPRKVGIFWSNTTWSYNQKFMNGVYRAYSSAATNGQRVKFITESTLDHLDKVDFLIVPGTTNTIPEAMEAITDFVDRGGKVVFFGEDCLIKDDFNQPFDSAKINYIKNNATIIESDILERGVEINLPDNFDDIMFEEYSKAGFIDVTLIDKETGERVTEVEFIHNTYNGDMIINPFNNSKTDAKTVEILINGEKVENFKDIKSGAGYNGAITLEPLEPYLIKVDTDGSDEKFTDIAHVGWAHEGIYGLCDKGIVNGVGNNKFAPDSSVTREELAKLIAVSMNADVKSTETPFEDVGKSEWYTPYVAAVYTAGIAEGVSKTRFGTGEAVSRQDLAVMVYRAAKDTGLISDNETAENTFADAVECADYATEAIATLKAVGAINGDEKNCFNPKDSCSRAEAAKIIYNIFLK